jgi:hypothetical protein
MLDEMQGGARAESGEGLKEERLPDGSSKVDLQGRFEQQSQTPPVAPASPGGRQIAIIDPQTGRLVSEEPATLMREREALRATLEGFEAQLREVQAASQDTSGLQEEQLATGAVKIDLMGKFQSPLVARIGQDGSVVVDHENPPAK